MKDLSKKLSFVLRHKPETIGCTLEPGGWVPVDTLLSGLGIDRAHLEQVVALNGKQRFGFDETGTRIRAHQGHSVQVDMQYEPKAPPAVLFHGTCEEMVETILKEGLLRMGRQYVHLSADHATAIHVGARKGSPVVLVIDAQAMAAEGLPFFCSTNGVWLAESVANRFVRRFA